MAQFCGNYRLEDRLNEGGMAEIFIADGPDQRHVIIRRLLPKYRFDLKKRRDFIRGLRIQQRMHHRNVVKVIELTTRALYPFAVMEFVGGMNLRQAFLRKDSVVQTPLPIFHQMLLGLQHIHSHGFLHLDFKPENILLQPDGQARIADFDLSQPILKTPRKQPSVQGTPAYLAPEQIRKEPVDRRTDIFALGLTAFELFTWRKPLARGQRDEIFSAYCDNNHAFPAPNTLNPAIPEALSQIISGCIQKKSDDRFSSVTQILRDFEGTHLLKNPEAIRPPDAETSWSNLDS